MVYSEEVRRRFEAAGADPAPADDATGSAEDRALGVWAQCRVQIRDHLIDRAHFHVFGCPHTIAAASLLAEWLQGRPVVALREEWASRLADQLQVPREKLGRLLVLEDALTACAERVEQG
jgi:NifU-like protein involved in Fe-S cluster formation